MSKYIISFHYKNQETSIQFGTNLKLKDIINSFITKSHSEGKILYFMYNGTLIEKTELTFNEIANDEDKLRKKMNVLVCEEEKDSQIIKSRANSIIKPKNIICPECKEDIQFFIKDYVITLSDCKNDHKKENIFLDKFDETQNIDISKIICQKCKKYNKSNVHNNTFYKCNTCDINLCPICCSNHDKKHYILNYDDKNYICKKHNKQFTQYCGLCKKNICIYCEKDHINHDLISFGQLIPEEKELNTYMDHLKGIIKKFNEEVDDIINKLNKIKKNMSYYYNISKSIIQNFNKEKLNYEILNNINSIIKNEDISYLNDTLINTDIYFKIKYFIDIYHKMNGEKHLILNPPNLNLSVNSGLASLTNSINSGVYANEIKPIQIEPPNMPPVIQPIPNDSFNNEEMNPMGYLQGPNMNDSGIMEMNNLDNTQILPIKNNDNVVMPMPMNNMKQEMNNMMPLPMNNIKQEMNNMIPMNNMNQEMNNMMPGMNNMKHGMNNMMLGMNDKMLGVNNMMMNNMMPGMNDMMPCMNNMMPCMNNMKLEMNKFGAQMPMINNMNNIPFFNNNLVNDNDDVGINVVNLLFEQQDNKRIVTIRINKQKSVMEAISKYLLKIEDPNSKYIYIHNNKILNLSLTIDQCGLKNGSRILVFNRN